jgi:hypothetical protein
MKTRTLPALVILGLALAFSSCQKEETPDPIELKTRELVEMVDTYWISKASVYLQGTRLEYRKDFTIAGNYLVITESNRHYNLDRMILFEKIPDPANPPSSNTFVLKVDLW